MLFLTLNLEVVTDMADLTTVQKRQLLEKTREMVQFNVLVESDFYKVMNVFAEALEREMRDRREE